MNALHFGDKRLLLDSPVVMGILNVTPDSFSDGGKYVDVDMAAQKAVEMITHGAKIIDIGGESSGPGSKDVPLEEELKRVIPVIEKIRLLNDEVWISVDTYKAEVASRAILAGANIVNDVTALRGDAEMIDVLTKFNVPVVIMYSKDATARTTKEATDYEDVVMTVKTFLQDRVNYLLSAGVRANNIVIDPGMGAFVSSVAKYSFEIIDRLQEICSLDYPVLVGPSRKSFLGGLIDERLRPSLMAAKQCVNNGAKIIRVHDVKETVEALQLLV